MVFKILMVSLDELLDQCVALNFLLEAKQVALLAQNPSQCVCSFCLDLHGSQNMPGKLLTLYTFFLDT